MTAKRSGGSVDKSPAVRKPKLADPPAPVIEPSELYKLEDELARSTTHAELEKCFLRESAMLRAVLQKFIDGDTEPCSSSVLLNVIQMRRCSRIAHYATAQLRSETNARLEQVEAKYLHLQNSSSEIQHLQKEISRCLQFSAGDEEIDLIPLDEFYAQAPEGVSRPEVTRTNEHEQRLARLTWEIAQRKALVDTLTEQEGRRNVLISSINGKEQRLKSLRSKISLLITAAKPVQEALGVGNASASSAEQRALFSLLPHDLSVLYVQAEAYRDIMEDTNLQVVIRGDANEALRLNRQQKLEAEEKEMSDDDEASDNDERQSSVVSDRLEVNKKEVTQPHPIFLKIDIGCQDDVKVALKLFYLPELRVTCMKYKISGKLPTHGIGVDLFASKYGRPYRFVQALTGSASLSGRDSPSKIDTSGIQLADVLHDVVKAIRDRVWARVKLVRELVELGKINAYIMIPVDYPKQLPLFAIVFTKVGTKEAPQQTFSSADSHIVKSLEKYVNMDCITEEHANLDSMLTRQLAHLTSGCDVVADLSPQFNFGSSTQRQHLYSRMSRGNISVTGFMWGEFPLSGFVDDLGNFRPSIRRDFLAMCSKSYFMMRLCVYIIGLPLMFMSSDAQTWTTGDNSTVIGCSTHCALNDDDLSCWNSTANFFSKVLIGQLRHYIAVQVDIDQWHRRHGKPQGQDMDSVAASIEQSFLRELHPKDILTNTTVIKIAEVISDRIRNISDHVITWVPHFQCPVPCEYRYNNYRNLFIASMILNVCLVLAVIPFMVRLIRNESIMEESDNLLMLADMAKLDYEERPFNWDFNNQESAPATSQVDAFDHCYLPSNDFDRFVNSTHDYYYRVGQWDLDEQEHSYAFQVPSGSTSGSYEWLGYEDSGTASSSSAANVHGVVLNTHICLWGTCAGTFETLEELQKHAEAHLVSTSRQCLWRGCSKMERRYAHRYLLSRHLRSHTGSTPYACDQCGSQFATRERMRLHQRSIHMPEVKYMCEVCDRLFKTTSERRHHMTRMHMKERLVCRHCGGLYSGRSVLSRHLKVCKEK
ncbi:hypothetical protein GCK32_003567 [Trichostrongylus colubriformis]|uniref:C2H2-type domain-containing protein n=1 Tax=Trichostrongylus colubriformis TaxID=6319 RepID=A0AAN8GB03_TRICO